MVLGVSAVLRLHLLDSRLREPNGRVAVSCTDGRIRIVSQPANQNVSITTFGGDAAGHKGKINDVCFCIAGDAQSKYVASVGGEWDSP